jgi:hypothetical protein
MGAAPSAPEQSTGVERQAMASTGRRGGGVDDGAMGATPVARPPAREDGWTLLDEPSAHAVPVLRLTPVAEPYEARDPRARSTRVAVTGATVMAITAGLGRRAGATGRLPALCSAGAGAAAVAPWLVPQLTRRRSPA